MRILRALPALGLLVVLGACSVPGPGEAPDGIWDPNEGANRRVHAFNRALDENVISGVGGGASDVLPAPVEQGVLNFADTLSLPRTVVNQILQARLGRASRNTLRFAINATIGMGGLVDVASDMGLPKDESDFGETLYVWGFPEGSYIELPVLGPSTERDAIGQFVDLALNPLDYAMSRETRYYKTGAIIGGKVLERGRYQDTVDSVLYDSADSYAQLRLIYLQNRRYELGETVGDAEDTYIDPTAIDTEGF